MFDFEKVKAFLDQPYYKVLDLERMYNESVDRLPSEEPGLMCMRRSYAMMAFNLAAPLYLANNFAVKFGKDREELVSPAVTVVMSSLVVHGLQKRDYDVEKDPELLVQAQGIPDFFNVVSGKEVSDAVAFGLHHVSKIDASSVPWLVDGYAVKFFNPIITARGVGAMIGETLTIPQDTIWQHVENGTYYRVLGGANQHSEDTEKFPPQVIYTDQERRTWARPLPEFLARMEHRYTMHRPAVEAQVSLA